MKEQKENWGGFFNEWWGFIARSKKCLDIKNVLNLISKHGLFFPNRMCRKQGKDKKWVIKRQSCDLIQLSASLRPGNETARDFILSSRLLPFLPFSAVQARHKHVFFFPPQMKLALHVIKHFFGCLSNALNSLWRLHQKTSSTVAHTHVFRQCSDYCSLWILPRQMLLH